MKHLNQTGFSLVGLMVASLIGLIVMGGALQMYIGGKDSFRARETVASATANANFALDDIRHTLVMAGRGMASNDSYTGAPKGTSVWGALTATEIVSGTDTTSDEIAFRIAQGRDCLGNDITETTSTNSSGEIITTGTVTFMRFFLEDDADGISQLMCEVKGGQKQPLISGVEMIKFLYGVDTTGDNAANYYRDAKEVDDAAQWGQVVSVRIGMVTGSVENVPASRRIDIDDIEVLHGEFTVPKVDGLPEKAYYGRTATVQLRNLGY